MDRKLIAATLLLLLLVSAGCAGMGSPGGQLGSQRTSVWGWQNLAGAALVLMLSLVALAYMAGSVLSDEKLKGWAKNELAQVFFSVVIFVFAIAVADSVDYWMKAISLGGDSRWQSYVNNGVCCTSASTCISGAIVNRGRTCHVEIATDYLQMLYERARYQAKLFLLWYSQSAFFAHMSIGASLTVDFLANLNSYPFAGLEPIANYNSLLLDLTLKTMMFIRAQQIFLDFLWYPLFPLMLSMGLVLRMIFFTRKLGGLLVALALSFYIVFPMFYVLADAIMWGFVGGWTISAANPHGWDAATMSNTVDENTFANPTQTKLDLGLNAKDAFNSANTKNLNIDMCETATTEQRLDIKGLMDNMRGSWNLMEHSTWYQQTLDIFQYPTGPLGKNGPVYTLANILVFTLVIPFLALMTTLASFKVLSGAIGGDIEISLISRLI